MARYGFAFFGSGVRWDSPDAHPTNMITLSRFLENPFDDPGISLAELLGFTTDHLERMTANNSGNALDGRITATTSALGLVDDSASDDQTKLGLRKARVAAKEADRGTLPEKVGRIAATVGAKYGTHSEQLTECFPQGRMVF